MRRLYILVLACLSTFIGMSSRALAFDEFDMEHAPSRFSLNYEDLTLEIKGRAR